MNQQRLIGGQTARVDFRAVAGSAFHNFNVTQGSVGHGDNAGGVLAKRGVGRDHRAGAGRGGVEGCRNSGIRGDIANNAGDGPRDTHITFVIFVSIKTSRVHLQVGAGWHVLGIHRATVAIAARQNFNMMRVAGNHIDRAALIVIGSCMISSNHALADGRQIQPCRWAAGNRKRSNAIRHAPVNRIIAEIIIGGIVTGGMQRDRLIRGRGFIVQFQSIAAFAFHNAHAKQRASRDGNGAGRVVDQRRMIGGNRSSANPLRGQSRGGINRRRKRADGPGQIPRHADIFDVIIIGIKTAGVNRQRLADDQSIGANFQSRPGSAG